jgi:hypothetical protein
LVFFFLYFLRFGLSKRLFFLTHHDERGIYYHCPNNLGRLLDKFSWAWPQCAIGQWMMWRMSDRVWWHLRRFGIVPSSSSLGKRYFHPPTNRLVFLSLRSVNIFLFSTQQRGSRLGERNWWAKWICNLACSSASK